MFSQPTPVRKQATRPSPHSLMHANVYGALSYGTHAYKGAGLPYSVFARLASTTSANFESLSDCNDPSSSAIPYPFPKHKHPTPYDIFHLKPGASPGAIKNRCERLSVAFHIASSNIASRLPACQATPSRRPARSKAAHECVTRALPSHPSCPRRPHRKSQATRFSSPNVQ